MAIRNVERKRGGRKKERQHPYPWRSVWRAVRRAAAANPWKSADAMVAVAMRPVGPGEWLNSTGRAPALDYPMAEEKRKTTGSRPQSDGAEGEAYEGAQALIGTAGGDLVEEQLTPDGKPEYILPPDNLNRAHTGRCTGRRKSSMTATGTAWTSAWRRSSTR